MSIDKYEETLTRISLYALEDMYKVMKKSPQKEAVKRVIEGKKKNIKENRGFGRAKHKST